MLKVIARILQIYLDFIKRHPAISLVLSLLVAAACVGAIYLILVNMPPWLVLPCFTGGCQ